MAVIANLLFYLIAVSLLQDPPLREIDVEIGEFPVGKVVERDVRIDNPLPKSVHLTRVVVSCASCVQAKAFQPMQIEAGGFALVKFGLDGKGKRGTFGGWAALVDGDSGAPFVKINFNGIVPAVFCDPSDLDLGAIEPNKPHSFAFTLAGDTFGEYSVEAVDAACAAGVTVSNLTWSAPHDANAQHGITAIAEVKGVCQVEQSQSESLRSMIQVHLRGKNGLQQIAWPVQCRSASAILRRQVYFGVLRRGDAPQRIIALRGVGSRQLDLIVKRAVGDGVATARLERTGQTPGGASVIVSLQAFANGRPGPTSGVIQVVSSNRVLCEVPYFGMVVDQESAGVSRSATVTEPDLVIDLEAMLNSQVTPDGNGEAAKSRDEVHAIIDEAFPLLFFSPEQAVEIANDIQAPPDLRAGIVAAQVSYEQRLASACRQLMDALHAEDIATAVRFEPDIDPKIPMEQVAPERRVAVRAARANIAAKSYPITRNRDYAYAVLKVRNAFHVAVNRAEERAREGLVQELAEMFGPNYDRAALRDRVRTRAVEGSPRSGQYATTDLHLGFHAPLLTTLRNACSPGGDLETIGPRLLVLTAIEPSDRVLTEARAALGIYERALEGVLVKWNKALLLYGDEILAAREAGSKRPLDEGGYDLDRATRDLASARWRCAEALAAIQRENGEEGSAEGFLRGVRKCMCPKLFEESPAEELVREARERGLADAAEEFSATRALLQAEAFSGMIREVGYIPTRSEWMLHPDRSSVAVALRRLNEAASRFESAMGLAK